jgi:hypothetical protein
MVSIEVLKKFGSTQDRLKEIFTATGCDEGLTVVPDSKYTGAKGTISRSEAKKKKADLALRTKLTDLIADRMDTGYMQSLNRYEVYAAVDLAWDSTPVTQQTFPLLLYAQQKLGKQACASALAKCEGGEKYVKKDKKGRLLDVDLPKFFAHNINLVRSYVTRRLAAQTNKYKNLYPYYKYHARGTGDVAQLRGEVMSQIAEIKVEQYGFREHDEQVLRDGLLYSWNVDFVRASWEKDKQYRFTPSASKVEKLSDKEVENVVVKEGVVFHNPHPTRTFWDTTHPLSTLNTDSGVQWCGYWDLVRYGDLLDNPCYYNKTTIDYGQGWINGCSEDPHANYYKIYYESMNMPSTQANRIERAWRTNSAKEWVGTYTAQMKDSSAFIGVLFMKVKPIDWGMGKYPYPVWLRLVVGGTEGTVIFAEFLPSIPGAYLGINVKEDRTVNASFAMSLLPYQDQLTNLFTQLLSICKAEQFMMVAVDTDFISDERLLEDLKNDIQSDNWFAKRKLLHYSGSNAAALGTNVRDPIKIYQASTHPQAIRIIFESIINLIQTVDKLENVSANETGQPIVRGNGGVTATEASLIGQTTNTVFNFTSDAFDTFRAAKKKIIYESWQAFGKDDFRVPVIKRYPDKIVAEAGMQVEDPDADNPDKPHRVTVLGHKRDMVYEFIFTSRDGAERVMNTIVANTLTQLVPMIQQAPGITKENFVNIVNAVIRNSGAGYDLTIDLPDEQADEPMAVPGQPGQASPPSPPQMTQ